MGRKLALVVGNNHYESPYSSLSKAVDDAANLAACLRDRLEFDAEALYNATDTQVVNALSTIVKELTDDSLFFFYFAGHGLCIGTDSQSLLCSNASEFFLNGVAAAPGAISPEVLSQISRMGRGDMFFCLDVCRKPVRQEMAGQEIQQGGAGLRDAIATPWDFKKNSPAIVSGRRQTLSSCADGEGAYDNGVFADALISEIKLALKEGRELKVGEELVERITPYLKFGQTPTPKGSPFVLVPGAQVKPPIWDFQRDEELERLRQRVAELERQKTIVAPKPPIAEPTPSPTESDVKSLWGESSTRKAGTRQTLKIGGSEYGFVWIPSGEFDMGSPESEEGRQENEVLHHVKLTRGFWMLETPTTQNIYVSVMKTNPSRYTGADRPVERVSWDDALEFCQELTKLLPSGLTATLPTEAQWEYACRAGTKTAYCWGDEWDETKAVADRWFSGTTPVKTYAPNGWGLYDMHGNVWEWTSDYYEENYPTGTVIDPKGPKGASCRVIRGGCWTHFAIHSRSASRFGYVADSL